MPCVLRCILCVSCECGEMEVYSCVKLCLFNRKRVALGIRFCSKKNNMSLNELPLLSVYPVLNASIFYTVNTLMAAIYVDGVSQRLPADPKGWRGTKELKVSIRKGGTIIAVTCSHYGDRAGFIASDSSGYLLTGTSWKCTKVLYENWQQPIFDDSAWPAAYAFGNNGIGPYGYRPQIRAGAQWIWTLINRGPRADTHIYCRVRLAVPA